VLEHKTLTVADHRGTRETTLEEALQHWTFQDAMAGKAMAIRQVANWIIKREKWLASALVSFGNCAQTRMVFVSIRTLSCETKLELTIDGQVMLWVRRSNR
jgi:hypothetical protein